MRRSRSAWSPSSTPVGAMSSAPPTRSRRTPHSPVGGSVLLWLLTLEILDRLLLVEVVAGLSLAVVLAEPAVLGPLLALRLLHRVTDFSPRSRDTLRWVGAPRCGRRRDPRVERAPPARRPRPQAEAAPPFIGSSRANS